MTPANSPIPEPVASALESARRDDRLLFIDSCAEWCGPCKVLDSTILVDPVVAEALARVVVLKVDADESVEAAEHFGVVGMPTLLILAPDGAEQFRHVGMVDAETLAREITARTARDSQE